MADVVYPETERLPLDGAFLLRPRVLRDDRGLFQETYVRTKYREAGVRDGFVQDNLAISKRGILRGLHCDPIMSKLVQVVRGKVFDVIVDVRKNSPTFGQWQGFELSDENHLQLFIPRGFLHGYLSLSDDVIFCYKQSAEYDPAREIGVIWNDPTLAIKWPVSGVPVLSDKDRNHQPFRLAFNSANT